MRIRDDLNELQEAKVQINHYSGLYTHYDEGSVNAQLLNLITRMATKPCQLLVDIGGGTGSNLSNLLMLLPADSGARVLLLDIARKGLMKAKHKGVDGILASATHIPLKTEIVDITLCVHVLEHIKKDNLAIAELSRITRRKGLLYVGTPNKFKNLYQLLLLPNLWYFIGGFENLRRKQFVHVRDGYDMQDLGRKFKDFKLLIAEWHGFLGYFMSFIFMMTFGFASRLMTIVNGRLHTDIIGLISRKVRDKVFSLDGLSRKHDPHGAAFYMLLRKK